MKRIVISSVGDTAVLHKEVSAMPEMQSGDIVVKVSAASINPVDIKTRKGLVKQFAEYPIVLGWDVSGTVIATGPQATKFKVGDEVIGLIAQSARNIGTYTEVLSAPEKLFAFAPQSIPLTTAAALPLAGVTAQQIFDRVNAHNHQRVLVAGAAGAVGRIITQMFLNEGVSVTALARETDREDLQDLGVEQFITSLEQVIDQQFDAVVDTADIASIINAVKDNGNLVFIHDGEDPASGRNIDIAHHFVNESGEQLQKISDLVDLGKLTVPIALRYALDDAAIAHRVFEQGGVRGKILLLP